MGAGLSVRSTLDDLDEYIATEGPFDAVMGFSQGASLAATYLAQSANAKKADSFKCAVFICAGDPFDAAASDRGEVRFLSAAVDGQVIRIPTAIILGSKDPDVGKSLNLSKLCCVAGREVVDHGGGHEVPTGSQQITLKMVAAIQKVIDRALSAQ